MCIYVEDLSYFFSMYVYICICVYVCVCVCMYMRVQTELHAKCQHGVRTYMLIKPSTYLYVTYITLLGVHICMCTYTARMHASRCAYVHTRTRAPLNMCIPACKHNRTSYIHTTAHIHRCLLVKGATGTTSDDNIA